MRHFLPAMIMPALLLTGCCASFKTAVRNGSGRDIVLTISRRSGPTETVPIRAGAKGRVRGVMPRSLDGSADSWVVSDGHSVFVFADVSPIATMPRAYISSSRFTRDFPCKRITQHVRFTPEMTIHAVRVIGYTAHEPFPFPIQATKRGDQIP
jgi:hypothetical protein